MKLQLTFLHLILLTVLALCVSCEKDDENPPNSAIISLLDPASPATLLFGEYVDVYHTFKIENQDGARIWIQPYTVGDISPGYVYSSSKVYTGEGKRKVVISVKEGDESEVVVDQLRVVCYTPDQDEILFEQFINVNYTFNSTGE